MVGFVVMVGAIIVVCALELAAGWFGGGSGGRGKK